MEDIHALLRQRSFGCLVGSYEAVEPIPQFVTETPVADVARVVCEVLAVSKDQIITQEGKLQVCLEILQEVSPVLRHVVLEEGS